jgi:hypothetical protein
MLWGTSGITLQTRPTKLVSRIPFKQELMMTPRIAKKNWVVNASDARGGSAGNGRRAGQLTSEGMGR